MKFKFRKNRKFLAAGQQQQLLINQFKVGSALLLAYAS